MIVICCRCKREYQMADNLFESDRSNRPLLKCPHCGFEHIVDFIPVDQTPEKLERLESIDLGPYDIILYATRYADKDRVDQSGSDDNPVTNWNTAAEFILATAFHTASKDTRAVVLKVQYRDYSDLDSMADVGATGEINYTTSTTVLSDNTSVVVGERLCSAYGGDTWQDGLENENDNVSPNSGTYDLVEDYYTEFQWAFNPASAEASHEYQFQIYDTNNSVLIGVCGATITMASAAPTISSVNSVAWANVSSVNSVAKANIDEIMTISSS